MNKMMKILLIVVVLFFIVIPALMFTFKLCPPQGPWPSPPWCEGGVAMPNVTIPPIQNVAPESNEITKYLSSPIEIYGRNSFEKIEDLPLSITTMAWGEHIPSNQYKNHWWMQREQKKGAKHISVVSIWNNDQWEKVEDLPAELKTAYITDFDGNPLYVQEKVFLNILDPALKQRLKDEMKSHIDAGTDGFAFDEHWGTAQAIVPGWGPGPFDNYSLTGFRNYLKEKYSADELRNRGISDISAFNYRDYLVNNNYRERYANEFWSNPAPFAKDYQLYLFQASNKVIQELIDYATSYARQKNRTLIITANANPLYKTDVFDFYDRLDLFVYEHEWFATWRKERGGEFPAGAPVTPSVKYAVSIGKRAAVMPMLHDVADLDTSARQKIFNHQMAETYASGGYYMFFPDINYIGINYTTPRATMYPYYAFVREHPEAFKELSFPAEVAVLRPSTVLQEDAGGADTANGFSIILMEKNIPHDVVSIDKIEKYKIVLAGGFAWSDADIEKLFSFIKNGGVVIATDSRFASRDANNREVSQPALEGLKMDGTHALGKGKFVFFNDHLWWKIWAQRDRDAASKILNAVKETVKPNTAPEKVQLLPYIDNKGRLLVHILNYDFSNGDFIRKENFQIKIRLPPGYSTAGKKLTLVSPDWNGSETLQFQEDSSTLNFTIPSLYIWDVAIVE
ncbi:MAG: hypothetical protein Q7U60_04500 [Candidatus Methanoperedens sp.]|nr:hypothetical protein [Candidatus Methanoperedens sp.]